MASGVYTAVYEDEYLGDPVFPDVPLGVKAEIQLGTEWTDITDYVAHSSQDGSGHPGAIAIQRGRPDEQTLSPQPAQAAFQLNNIDGRFTSRNPASPYYGSLSRNTPVRISVPADEVHLRNEVDKSSYASCPDSAGVSITGDTEIQVEYEITDYGHGFLADKWVSGSSQSWLIELELDGTVKFFVSTTGTDSASSHSTMPLPVGHQALKITLDVDNGASGHTVTFYTSDSIGGTWTQLGAAVVTAGTITVADSTGPVKVGRGCIGKFYAFKLLSGIGGTVKASPDFSTATDGGTSITDAQSNVWTLTGTAEYSGRDYRFHGELSSLPTTWDNTGQDVWTPVTAAGRLRRLQQSQSPPVLSTMTRTLQYKSGTSALHAYWPCEDGVGATSIASGIGGPAMRINSTAQPTLSSDSSFACSLPIPVTNGSEWDGSVPAYTSHGSAVVRFLMTVPSGPAVSDGDIIARVGLHGGSVALFTLRWKTGGGLSLTGWDPDGNNVFDTGSVAFAVNNSAIWVDMDMQIVGGNLQYQIQTLVPGASSALSFTGHITGGTIGNIAFVNINPNNALTDIAIGQIGVQSSWSSLFDDAAPLDAYTGELAANRFYRLCNENGVEGSIIGYPALSVPMGAQLPNNFLNLLQECEDADRGQTYEPRHFLGIAYRTLASMTNQTPALTLDYSADHLGPPLTPTDDDLFTQNDVTATNPDGSSARAVLDDGSPMSISEPPVGVGEYATSVSVNVATDDQLPDQAGWRLNVGTVNEERYPSVVVDLAVTQSAVQDIAPAVKKLDVGDYFQITDTPDFMPPGPVKELAWGFQEVLGDYCYEVTLNAVPETPLEVGQVNDDSTGLGKVDTLGSSLHADITSSATSISVDTTDTYLWTTDSADCPIDIAIGGEQITVTAISGGSSPQTFTVTRSVNGVVKAHSADDVVKLYRPSIVALTG